MSFTPNIPASGQTLGSSRPQVLDNFTALRNSIKGNHVDPGVNTTGLHTHVDMTSQASDPNPATGIVSHYSKSVSGVTEWFFQRENSGAVIQMSTSSGIPVLTTNGQTFLPGGLILKFGNISSVANNFITFSTPFPNNIFSLQVTVAQSLPPSEGAIYEIVPSSVTVSGFTVFLYSTGVGKIHWMAIGN